MNLQIILSTGFHWFVNLFLLLLVILGLNEVINSFTDIFRQTK